MNHRWKPNSTVSSVGTPWLEKVTFLLKVLPGLLEDANRHPVAFVVSARWSTSSLCTRCATLSVRDLSRPMDLTRRSYSLTTTIILTVVAGFLFVGFFLCEKTCHIPSKNPFPRKLLKWWSCQKCPILTQWMKIIDELDEIALWSSENVYKELQSSLLPLTVIDDDFVKTDEI